MAFETEWTQDRLKEDKFINQVLECVALWRKGGYQGITSTTQRLLEYRQQPDRDRRLFFCQIEALECASHRMNSMASSDDIHPLAR